MDDDDLDLTLNLNLTYSGSRSDQKNRPKVFGNRSERIKQRRQIKHKAESGAADTETASPVSKKRPAPAVGSAVSDDNDQSRPPPAKAARKGAEGKSGGGGGGAGGKGVISSLFRHNPDIPSVKSGSVKGVKEAVFSSTHFHDLPLHPHLVSNLEEKLQLATMTRVQQLSIPAILQEKDVLIKSQTGSGKTLAYAVPIVHCLSTLPRKVQRSLGPFALVIVPTRELAIQSYNTFSKLLQSAVWIVAGCLMGGEKRKTEKARIRKGINVLVSTPGRLLDHLQHTDSLTLTHLRYLVIDEADRLLELGYERDVAQIITILNERCVQRRQTILASATLSPGVERLSGMMLKDHESIDASAEPGDDPSGSRSTNQLADSGSDSTFALPEKLKQYFVVVPCKVRLVSLAAFILWKCKMQSRRSKMVVFLSTQDSVEFHHRLFSLVLNPPPPSSSSSSSSALSGHADRGGVKGQDGEDSVDLFRLHGDMAQKDRTQVFQEFTEASSGVLLCTDVASRGLHLPRVDWIVQYTTPGATVDYIHRVGRTARAGKQGNALLFLLPSETEYVQELNKHNISVAKLDMKDVLTTLLPAIPSLPSLRQHTPSKRPMPRTYEEASTFLQDRFEENVLRNPQLKSLAVKGYQSFVRAYATYPSHLKEIFDLRHLHLGHVTKSFALREAPSHLHVKGIKGKGRGAKGQVIRGRKEGKPSRLSFDFDKNRFDKHRKRLPLSVTVSEFGSGLETVKGVSGVPSKHKNHKKKPAFG